MSSYFGILVRRVPNLAMLLPAIMAPFLLAGFYSLPKATLLRLMLVIIAGAWLGKVVLSDELTVAGIAFHPATVLFASRSKPYKRG